MYLVKLINNNEEIYINNYSTHESSSRITGDIKFGINTIDTFTFRILPNNIGYNKIFPLKTLVEVINIKTNTIEFKGRVLLPKSSMSEGGVFAKVVVCESELGYLMDSTQRYGEYRLDVKPFLQVILDNHNKQVSEDKKIYVGNVTVTDSNENLYRFLGYEKTFPTIIDKLVNRLGGELKIRYDNGIRYLDYLASIGSLSSVEIRISKNLKSIEQEIDPSQVITRLVPLGAKIKKIDSEGNEVDTEERLTIKEVNNNLDYIDDTEAMALFGIVESSQTWDDVNIASNLYSKGVSFLASNNKVKKKYSINALDLSIIGLDIQAIDLYNTYRVINPTMSIDENLRVIEKTINIDNPQNSSIVVGDKFEDIKQFQLSVKRTTQVVNEVNSKVNSVVDKTNQLEGNIVNIGGEIGDINDNLGQTGSNVENMANSLNVLTDTVISNTDRITTLEADMQILDSDISIVKADTTQLKADMVIVKAKLDEILAILNGGA